MKSIVVASFALAVLLCTGCASVTQGTTHMVRIETLTDKGEQLDGADCTLASDQGTTLAKSGSSTLVRRSSKDMEISCAAAGQADAKGRLVSRANVGLAGNIIVGGAIGAVIDHNTGAAYTYPTWVRLVFGQFNVYDRRDEREGVALAPAGLTVAQSPPPAQATVVTQPPPAAQPVLVAQPAPASQEPQKAAPGAWRAVSRGDTFDYRLTDRQTGRQQTIVLRAERTQAGEVSFNGGARVEMPTGAVKVAGALTGELDNVTPPEGWMPAGRMPVGAWKMRYRSIVPGSAMHYDLQANIEGEEKMLVDGQELRTVRIGLRGWAENQGGMVAARASYQGTAWVAPELGRVVRFEVKSRSGGGSGSSHFIIDEMVELVRVGRD